MHRVQAVEQIDRPVFVREVLQLCRDAVGRGDVSRGRPEVDDVDLRPFACESLRPSERRSRALRQVGHEENAHALVPMQTPRRRVSAP
jgi:hypothetical protein